MIKRLFQSLPVLVLLVVTMVSNGVVAQEPTADDLHERLDAARAEIARVQSEAGTVKQQIASIDKQIAAVENALDLSRQLAEQTQAKIAAIRLRIRDRQRIYERVRGQAQDVVARLYKEGPSQQIALLLTAKTLNELTSLVEYSGEIAESSLDVMVAFKRAKAELDVETAELEVVLKDALEVRREKLAQSQHLNELRDAQTTKLSTLERRIAHVREEADAIAARSAEIQADLASTFVAAPSASSAAGFAWPITGAITSGYGERWGRIHSGIDIDCVTGAPIRAAKTGTIVSATYDGSGYGYYTVIDHGGGFASLYAHMSEQYVTGGGVAQGETIGACGSTGASTGDHLHFEIRVNGAPQDPLAYLP